MKKRRRKKEKENHVTCLFVCLFVCFFSSTTYCEQRVEPPHASIWVRRVVST